MSPFQEVDNVLEQVAADAQHVQLVTSFDMLWTHPLWLSELSLVPEIDDSHRVIFARVRRLSPSLLMIMYEHESRWTLLDDQ